MARLSRWKSVPDSEYHQQGPQCEVLSRRLLLRNGPEWKDHYQTLLEPLNSETVWERLDRFGDLSGKPNDKHMDATGTEPGRLPWTGGVHAQRRRLQSLFDGGQCGRAPRDAALSSRDRRNAAALLARL